MIVLNRDGSQMERRTYNRVADMLPLTYHVISKAQYDERAALYAAVPTSDRGPSGTSALAHLLAVQPNPDMIPIITLLRTLHEKVDLLLARLSPAAGLPADGPTAQAATAIDISGNGLLMLVSERLTPDTRVDIVFPAPTSSPFSIELLGTVVREASQSNGRWATPTTFTAVHPLDRTAMVAYVSHRESALRASGQR